MIKVKVISGGQTGIDKMSLEVAKELGFKTGGTAPKEWRTEKGTDLSLKEFGLIESEYWSYTPRTGKNIDDSNGTVLYGNMSSTGSKQTIQLCIDKKKPYIVNPGVQEFLDFIYDNQISILNIAGNRRSKMTELDYITYRHLFYMSLRKLL